MVEKFLIQFAASYGGTVAFSVLFFVPREFYSYCGSIGAIGWTIYWVLTNCLQISDLVGTFGAAAFVVLSSRICGVYKKCPATLFLLSGIFPLVPGVGIYWSIYYLIMGETILFLNAARHTIGIALAIVLGIVFVFEVPQKRIHNFVIKFSK